MINLIPQQAKKKISIEYWVRVLSVWLIIFSVALIIATCLLLPTQVLIKYQISAYENSAQEASKKVSDYQDVSKTLATASERAQVILTEIKEPRLSDFFFLIMGKGNSEVSISEISIKRGKEGVDPITVTGLATDRQALASFRERLLQEAVVESVDLPISNLAKEKNIQYAITVTVKKEI